MLGGVGAGVSDGPGYPISSACSGNQVKITLAFVHRNVGEESRQWLAANCITSGQSKLRRKTYSRSRDRISLASRMRKLTIPGVGRSRKHTK